MSRPLSVIRGAVMLSMILALMAAFTPNAGAQVAGDILVTATDAVTGEAVSCVITQAEIPATVEPGDLLTAAVVDSDGTTVGTGGPVAYTRDAVNEIAVTEVVGETISAGDTANVVDATGAPTLLSCVLAGAPAPDAGSLTINKLGCTDAETATITIAEPAAADCQFETASFAIVDVATALVVQAPTVVGTATISLAPGDYTIQETAPEVTGAVPFTIFSGETTFATAINPADVVEIPTETPTVPVETPTVPVETPTVPVETPTPTVPTEGDANAFVDVEKLVCTETDDDPAGDVDIFVPGEFVAAEAPEKCRAATEGEFSFTLFSNDLLYSGGEIVAIDNAETGAEGQALLGAFVDATIGTRTVFVAEDATGVESIDLILAPGDTAEVLIINYVEDVDVVVPPVTGDVEIAKLYCLNEDLAGTVEFEVLGPEFPVEATGVTGQAGVTQPDNCVPGAAEFAIYLFGDKKADPILVTVGSDGLIVIDGIIPVTTDDEPHKIVELGTGAGYEAFFDVEEGAVTKIIVINYVGADEKDGGDDGDDKKDEGDDAGDDKKDDGTTGGGTTTGGGKATTLPDTGAGAGQSGAEYGMGLFLVLGGLAAAGVSLRRRAA